MKKMLHAKAMARIDGSVILMITVLRGPVLRNRKNSATNIAIMQPVKVGTVLSIADAGGVMPPKSTWFEPKLLSGLVVHTFE